MSDPVHHSKKETNKETRPLSQQDTDRYMPVRATTGPLDEALPWVIEFRIVGTASTIQAQVHENMVIGRGDPAKGVFPAVDLGAHGGHMQGVSRQHAVVLVHDNRIKIRDLNSVNGTRLNGRLLDPGQEYRLRHGDELEIGQMRLQVRFAVVPTIGANDSMIGAPMQAVIPQIGSGQHVLIVEDDASVARVFELALRHAGFKVTVMNSAVSALGLMTNEMPDLVILDLILPDMNGHDLVRLLRRQKGGDRAGIIVCSGATGGFQSGKAAEAGADVFLGKPVSVEQLLKAITGLVKPSHAQQDPPPSSP